MAKPGACAEEAGFNAALNSDHFHPWTDAQGHSGFAWSLMGAALATTGLSSISSSLQQHIDWLGEDLRLGFERL